jgi:hypothetical protein
MQKVKILPGDICLITAGKVVVVVIKVDAEQTVAEVKSINSVKDEKGDAYKSSEVSTDYLAKIGTLTHEANIAYPFLKQTITDRKEAALAAKEASKKAAGG